MILSVASGFSAWIDVRNCQELFVGGQEIRVFLEEPILLISWPSCERVLFSVALHLSRARIAR